METRPPAPALLALLHRIRCLPEQTADPHEALAAVLGGLLAHFGACSGSISLFNPDTHLLEIEVQQGLPEQGRDIALDPGRGVTGWVILHGRPLLVGDVATDPRYIPVRPDVRCEMAAPLDHNGHIVGVVNLDSNEAGGFNADNLSDLVACASATMAVLRQLWQLRQLGGKALQLETILRLGSSLVTQLSLPGLLKTVADDARQLTGCKLSRLYLHVPGEDAMRLEAWSAAAACPPSAVLQWPVNDSIAGPAFQTRRQVEFTDLSSPDYIDLADLPGDSSLRSTLGTPLQGEGGVIGVLVVCMDRIHRFTDDERRFLLALANLAAIAVQNARLYARVFAGEESLRKNDKLTTLGLLAAEIAHEIRNPLTVIKLLHGSLGLEFPDGDPRRRDVEVIGEKLDQLEDIVSRVLNVARAPAVLHSRWPVGEIIGEMISLVRLKLQQGRIALEFTPPPDPLFVDVNKGQLQQVLLNLILNATQAMPDGGRIRIDVRTDDPPRPADGHVHIDVADTGTGIPRDIRDRIFDSFLSGRPDGTGLGLAISKRILAAHRGDISVFQTGPEGTTLRLTLPLV